VLLCHRDDGVIMAWTPRYRIKNSKLQQGWMCCCIIAASKVWEKTQVRFVRSVAAVCLINCQMGKFCLLLLHCAAAARSPRRRVWAVSAVMSQMCVSKFASAAGCAASSLQTQAQVVGRFRNGELNLLVATNIGSEGMDFKQCAAVVAFEPPPDLTSYIQVCNCLLNLECFLCFVSNRAGCCCV
jgi:hypothetical protein